MANQEQVELIQQGAEVLLSWMEANPDKEVDLSGADLARVRLGGASLAGVNFRQTNLRGADLKTADLARANLRKANLREADLGRANLRKANLREADLGRANLREADLGWANLREADLGWANLSQADLREANLGRANLRKANLREADLGRANLRKANLREADLSRANLAAALLSRVDLSRAKLDGADLSMADLQRSILVETSIQDSSFAGSRIYGISAWDVAGIPADQSNLIVTPHTVSAITVDNLQVAQFIYLMLNNRSMRDVIDTVTSKIVLILGRFTGERKPLLDAVKDNLRKLNYVPVVLDFDIPSSRSIAETLSTLAHMARFIIADMTSAAPMLQTLQSIVQTLVVPVQTLQKASQTEYRMYEHFRSYPWVLPTFRYETNEDLMRSLATKVIAPAEAKAKEMATIKAEGKS